MEIKEFIASHKDDMKEALAGLVKIPSVKGPAAEGAPFGIQCKKALDYALSRARALGLQAHDLDGYAGYVDIGEGSELLGVLVHLDVVPAGDESKWTHPPFGAEIVDGVMYGRGCEDDKGPAIASLYALAAAAQLGRPFKRRVRLILGCDEESDMSDLKYYKKHQPVPDLAFSPDAEFPVYNAEKGIVHVEFTATFDDSEKPSFPSILFARGGTVVNAVPDSAEAETVGIALKVAQAAASGCQERTGVKFTVEREGDETLKIRADGVGAHGSTPDKGNNAVTALLELLTSLPFERCQGFYALERLSACFPHGDFYGRSAGIAGSSDAMGPTTASLNLLDYDGESVYASADIRHCELQHPEAIMDTLRRRADMSVTSRSAKACHMVNKDCELVQALLKVYERNTGLKGECRSMGGGTYARAFPGKAVSFGARFIGRDETEHSADERVILEDVYASAAIFADAIAELALK